MRVADIEGSERCTHCKTGPLPPRAGGRHFKLREYALYRAAHGDVSHTGETGWLHDNCIPDFIEAGGVIGNV